MKLVILLAYGYVILGAAGFTLAIPPGYASPVFPAAGLALAVTLWFGRRALPGVWLGSAILNLAHAWLGGTLGSATTLVALIIANGATLQAEGGRWLVTRVQGEAWRRLEREQDALGFLLLGGVLAGVLSSTIGVAGLAACGLIEGAQAPFTWWNWYLGDLLGVLVFAPLTLALLDRTDPLWRERRRRLLIPMLLTLALAMLAFYGTARWEGQTQDAQVETDGTALARRIGDRLIAHREVLYSLRHFIQATPDFSFAQFELFTRITLRDNPDIFALSFNDLVTDAERPAFEERISGLSPLGPYRITEHDRLRRLVQAGTRPDYVAVRYIVPIANNQPAVGYDINSEPIRHGAIERARATGTMAVTAPIRLVQEHQARVGVLGLLPIAAALGTDAPDGSRPLGFAVAVIKVDEMVEIATRGQVPAGLVFQVTDPQAPPGQELLYRSDAQTSGAGPRATGHWETWLRMGDRPWVLSVLTTEAYRQEHRPWLAWAVGVAGLVFATLLQVLMLGMTGRTAAIQRYRDRLETLVEERTRQLANTNRKLTERSRQAESANRAKTAFLANMSHEIRTPMNAILGLAQVLERDAPSPAQRHLVQRIQTAGKSLLGLINDVLDLSKIEAGRLRVETRPFDLSAILGQVESLMSELARAKGLDLRIETPPDLAHHLLGDPLRLEQILVNLVGNGVKFTERGEVRLSLAQVRRTADSVRLRFEVRDTGIGIAPEHLVTLGTPFSQADGTISRRFGGTGLGLAITRHLIQALGGTFGCESTPGVGSLFWFQLPFARDTLGDGEARPAGPPPQPTGPRLTGRHYLVVDDNPLNLEVIAHALQQEGATATLATDGQQALADLQAHPGRFAAVLMDIQMPVLDGLAATRAIRQEPALRDLPVIALSAGVLTEQRQTALDAGVDDFLAKPVDLEDLVRVLLRWPGPPAAAGTAVPAGPAAPAPAPDPAAAFPSIPGLDTQRAALLLGNDRPFFLTLLGEFVAAHADAAARVRHDLEQGQGMQAVRLLHTLRGTAGTLGAQTLGQRAADLETAIKAGAADCPPLLGAFAAELAAVLEAVAPWIEPPRQDPAGAFEPAPLDPAQLAALRSALERHDLAALDLFADLRPALARVLDPAGLEALSREIADLRFEAALARLAPYFISTEDRRP